ncbi:MAG TPA: hypothetical protein VE377_07070 [Candidatus Dormibacteraeota bacterium]|nr:hypothetical protein [Candidatus Dormibacteraeota bacterium]
MEAITSDFRAGHEQALAHMLAVLAKTEVSSDPCVHGVIQELFPQTYYERLLEALPTPEMYNAIPSAEKYEATCRSVLMAKGERHHLWLAHLFEKPDSWPLTTSEEHKIFWYEFAEHFASPSFIKALTGRFLGTPFSSRVDLSIRFVRETGGVYILPHLDMPHKLMSMICYLGPNGMHTALQGTSMYELGVTGIPIVRKSIPFVPNSALVLPRTEQSLHGVEPHIAQPNRLTLHFYLQESGTDARGIVRVTKTP